MNRKRLGMTMAGILMLVLGGCTTLPQAGRSDRSTAPVNDRVKIKRFQEIGFIFSYESAALRPLLYITFHQEKTDSAWSISVESDQDVNSRSEQLAAAGQPWNVSQCNCTREQFLALFEQALSAFQAEKPEARIDMLTWELSLEKETWGEVLSVLQKTLSSLEGKMPNNDDCSEGPLEEKVDSTIIWPLDGPEEAFTAVGQYLEKATTVTALRRILQAHGLDIHDMWFETDQFKFKGSLEGVKYKKIAKLEDAGVYSPGYVKFLLSSRVLKTEPDSTRPSTTRP